MRHISPLRYPGGKSCIHPFISSLINENSLQHFSYAEPYAGGGGLALRLLLENAVDSIHLNDLDRSIYAFWHSILHEPDAFCDWLSHVGIDMAQWKYFHEVQEHKDTVDLLELGKSTFFLNRTNVSGIIKGGPIGGHAQVGKYKLDVRFNREALIDRIECIARRSDDIHISNLDGVEFIKRLNEEAEDIFIYLDPPYYKKGSSLYMNYFQERDHVELRDALRTINKPWIVSYDNNEFILNLYENYARISYQLSQCTSNRVGEEVIVLSTALHADGSLAHLKSPQTIAPKEVPS